MHDRLDKSNETTNGTVYQSWGIGIFVLPVLLAAFLAGLAIIRPDVSRWVSESEQAELVGAGLTMGGDSGASRAASPRSAHRQG
jgi:hypothetical protein